MVGSELQIEGASDAGSAPPAVRRGCGARSFSTVFGGSADSHPKRAQLSEWVWVVAETRTTVSVRALLMTRGMVTSQSRSFPTSMSVRARSPGAANAKVSGTWGGAVADLALPRVLTYPGRCSASATRRDAVGLRTSTEWRTLAEALDQLVKGNAGRAGDLLIQWSKALETSVGDEVGV